MLRQVLEIAKENTYISAHRGFLQVNQKDGDKREIPISDIAVLLFTAQSVSCSKYVLNSLAEQGTPTILCGRNYSPKSIVLPLINNYEFAGRLQKQIQASVPLNKSLWKIIVQCKIENQSKVLKYEEDNQTVKKLMQIKKGVLSGDSSNREAYAAKLYWHALFGSEFRRDPDKEGINALLNYGYGVLRGIVTRAVCASGLHPSLGIHHANKYNNLCLSDDLMEPFRPLVDFKVKSLVKKFGGELQLQVTSEIKKELVSISWIDVKTEKGISPLVKATEYYTNSLVESYKDRKNCLCVPEIEF